MNEPLLYTPAEAAELLKVPESWLRKKAAARQIPATFIGKHLRFTSDDLAAVVAAGARPPRHHPTPARLARDRAATPGSHQPQARPPQARPPQAGPR
jgi:excisionase family DNA binding protein